MKAPSLFDVAPDAAHNMQETMSKAPPVTDVEKARQLPDPQGYFLLCAVPQMDKAYESGLIKADQTVRHEELLAAVLFVVKVGPKAYDDARFGGQRWCKEGDFVIVRPNTGTRLRIHNQEFRIIADDQVECTVQDPRGIKRV